MKSLLLSIALLGACTDGGSDGPPTQHLPRPTTPTFTLLLSNQSFALPSVDMTVHIDGQLAVTGNFKVEGQHTWIPFDFDISTGTHQLEVETDTGEAVLSKSFVMDDRKWATVMFWYYPNSEPEPTPKHFSFDLSDSQPLFD